MYFKKSIVCHCVFLYGKILKSCLSTFGPGLLFFYYLVKIPFRLSFVKATMALDCLFYPGFAKTRIERPLFIIAHPRSASSFFHSLLGEKSQFVTFSNWEVRNPAIIMKPFMQKFPRLGAIFSLCFLDLRTTPWRIKMELKTKKNKITGRFVNIAENSRHIAPEEELLFANILDTQYVAVETPIGFTDPDIGFPELCFHDQHEHESQSMKFFKGCLQRQIFYQKRKQVVAKMNFSLFRVKHILQTFPDARFVFIIRSPFDTIPSHLTAQRQALDLTYGLENIQNKDLDRFFKNRYLYNIKFYQQLVTLLVRNEIPDQQILLIRYEELQQDLLKVVEKVRKFGDLEFNTELKNKINTLSKKQHDYKADHTNLPLDFFGLSPENIKADFKHYFDYFKG